MRRRAAVRALAAALPLGLVGCLSSLPRATGPRTPPEPDDAAPDAGEEPTVADIDVEPTDDDMLRVLATVRNPQSAPITPTVVARVTVDGEEHARRAEVEVPANGRATASIEFEVTFAAFSSGGSVSASLA